MVVQTANALAGVMNIPGGGGGEVRRVVLGWQGGYEFCKWC